MLSGNSNNTQNNKGIELESASLTQGLISSESDESKPEDQNPGTIEDAITCSVTGEIFYDPALLPSGHSIERDLLKKLDRNPFTRDPLKDVKLSSLPTNFSLGQVITAFLKENKDAEKKQFCYVKRKKAREEKNLIKTHHSKTISSTEVASELRVESQNPQENDQNVRVEINPLLNNHPAQTTLRMIQIFLNDLHHEILELKDCRHFVKLVPCCLFILVGSLSLAMFISNATKLSANSHKMMETPTYPGSLTTCVIRNSTEDQTCESLRNKAITTVCDALCDAIETASTQFWINLLCTLLSAVGSLISASNVRASISSLKSIIVSFFNSNNMKIKDFSTPLQSDAFRLFAHLSNNNHEHMMGIYPSYLKMRTSDVHLAANLT